MRNLAQVKLQRPNDPPQPGRIAELSVPFTALAVAVAFALVMLPGPKRDYREVAIAALLGLGLIGLSFCWRRFPRTTQLGLPLGYLLLAALLRESDGGSASGFGGLFLLPVLWLALFAGRTGLVVGLCGLLIVEVVPLLAFGAPRYPVSGWRSTVIRTSVAVIAGFTIQYLLAQTRRRAVEATRWSQRLESLNEVGNALATETELQPLLKLVAARLRELLDARVVLVLLPVASTELQIAAVDGEGAAEFLGELVPRAGSRSGHVLDQGQSERADSLPDEPGFDHYLHGRLAAQTSLWVPLVVRDRPIGVIAAHDKLGALESHFSDDDLRLAETFASRAALAVDLSERVARDALRRVVAAQEVERRRLARELHDETGQTLTSIMLGLKSVEDALDDVGLRQTVASLGRQVATTMQDVRRIALELRPKALDDYGLVAALERLATTFSQQTGIVVDLEARLPTQQRLPSEIETALYRIVQEGLTNIVRHAKPSRASVLLTPKDRSVLLVVEDDGAGFDPGQKQNGGFGLESMRERVQLLNGRLTIESSKGTGTTLVIEVPVK